MNRDIIILYFWPFFVALAQKWLYFYFGSEIWYYHLCHHRRFHTKGLKFWRFGNISGNFWLYVYCACADVDEFLFWQCRSILRAKFANWSDISAIWGHYRLIFRFISWKSTIHRYFRFTWPNVESVLPPYGDNFHIKFKVVVTICSWDAGYI